MPRTARASVADICYHVINRGNGRAAVFHDETDYAAFMDVIEEACERIPMRVSAYCLMPNHFHLVLWPRGDGDLSRWMQWVMTCHVRRHHRRYKSSGHVWQGRFKAFPVQKDAHLLAVLRYVERNPVRAKLVERAEDWRWSSLTRIGTIGRAGSSRNLARQTPVPLPRGWRGHVNSAETLEELETLRNSVNRGAPYGGMRWAGRTAQRLGLEAAMRPRGRPRLKPDPKQKLK